MANRKIYIARHGERLDFVDPDWYANSETPHDPPLTDRGRGQATDLGKFLRDSNIKHVYVSPFSRCVNTAFNAAREIHPSISINVEPGACEWLNEDWYDDAVNGPVWRSTEDLAKEFPSVNTDYKSVFPMTHNFDAFPETEDECLQRCLKMVRAILDTVEGDGEVLIVGHGSSVEALNRGLVPGIQHRMVTCKLLILTWSLYLLQVYLSLTNSLMYFSCVLCFMLQTDCCLTECFPTSEPMKFKVGLHCDTSFLTHPEHERDTRYI